MDALSRFANPELRSNGNEWRWLFFVTNEEGAVYRWKLAGSYSPFTIRPVEKSRVADPGTLVPLVVVHGTDDAGGR